MKAGYISTFLQWNLSSHDTGRTIFSLKGRKLSVWLLGELDKLVIVCPKTKVTRFQPMQFFNYPINEWHNKNSFSGNISLWEGLVVLKGPGFIGVAIKNFKSNSFSFFPSSENIVSCLSALIWDQKVSLKYRKKYFLFSCRVRMISCSKYTGQTPSSESHVFFLKVVFKFQVAQFYFETHFKLMW